MNTPRQRKAQSPSQSSQPPAPSPIDRLIEQNQGSSAALEASRPRLASSKRAVPPTPLQRIEQLTWEKTALQEELAKCQRQGSAYRDFKERVRQILDQLQFAVFDLRKALKEIDDDFNKALEEGVDATSIKVGIQRSDI